MEASEIFLRLLSGETIHSDDIRETILTKIISITGRLATVQNAAGTDADEIPVGGDTNLKRFQLYQRLG